ncbi:MAG: RNA helicase [Rickettsiales bacterium]|nr:MAG: RNA helicase [Rickettsiales bacterium]
MTTKATDKEKDTVIAKKTCGIIMPIAPHPDYPTDHWKDVLNILIEAVEQTEFEAKLVSDDVAIGLIHDRIVTNIYNNEVIVCDVSSKNPNVMFELGLRLAFDKPTIIIKDENTGYSFDTGIIEHISYPSSLRFGQIVKFKEELISKINATYRKFQDDTNYSPFLKSFGKTIVPATIQQTEIPEGKFIMSQLDSIQRELRILRSEKRNDYSIRKEKYLFEKEQEITLKSIIEMYFDKHEVGELLNNSELFSNIKR